jgi:hypothetical protein
MPTPGAKQAETAAKLLHQKISSTYITNVRAAKPYLMSMRPPLDKQTKSSALVPHTHKAQAPKEADKGPLIRPGETADQALDRLLAHHVNKK